MMENTPIDVQIETELFAIEDLIVSLDLKGERVLPTNIIDRISSVEFCTHVTNQGKVLRWCVVNMINGYGITSPMPSCAVSVENDNEIIGRQECLKSALANIWQFEGYLASERRHLREQGLDVESQLLKLSRIMSGEFGDKVGNFLTTYVEGNYHKK